MAQRLYWPHQAATKVTHFLREDSLFFSHAGQISARIGALFEVPQETELASSHGER